ncbi:response regulator [Rhizobium sp. ARZ01]|uniref:response regulator n=1 Tax=Rhizobium sp. ARZ01 TaxID=2769313 RepID=UPI00177F37BA|nr:response regulator [Rhizobium sp. ARZ01]MBD9372596.1 response regulator [Rhizobium sp. ARZ01]
MRLLLVEDDELLGKGVLAGLTQSGFAVDWAKSGEDAEVALETADYDAVVLDIGLPRMDGITLLQKRRRERDSRPILLLTARDTVADRIGGLDAGADDYLVKPFDLDELLARLRALLRRSKGKTTPILNHGRLQLDPAGHAVTLDGKPVVLSQREFAVLQDLLMNAGRVLSRGQLEDRLYGWGEEIDSNAIEVHIHNLRRKLYPDAIRTIRGVGYIIPESDA